MRLLLLDTNIQFILVFFRVSVNGDARSQASEKCLQMHISKGFPVEQPHRVQFGGIFPFSHIPQYTLSAPGKSQLHEMKNQFFSALSLTLRLSIHYNILVCVCPLNAVINTSLQFIAKGETLL